MYIIFYCIHLQVYTFKKPLMPEKHEELEDFATKLAKFGVSLHDYRKSFQEGNSASEDTR